MSDGMLDQLKVIDIIFGRWRSQIVHAGVELNVFEHIGDDESISASELATKIQVDWQLLYRLLRALSSLGFLAENGEHRFSISAMGKILQRGNPNSLRSMVLLEEGQAHYAAWKHLPALIRDGSQDGFCREFGMSWVQYLQTNSEYGLIFQDAMSSYSSIEASAVCDALPQMHVPLDHVKYCDIGGGDGYLLAKILKEHVHATGVVFDLPEVITQKERHMTTCDGLQERVEHVGGNMFECVPEGADIYLMKHIIHDWDDAECEQILKAIRRAAHGNSKLIICEMVIPEHGQSHFSKIFDIHMLCATNGRQRTVAEISRILTASGWLLSQEISPVTTPLSCVVASPAIH